MSKRSNVSYVKPAEPAFLRKFKEDVGYKSGPTVETKSQQLTPVDSDSGQSDPEDEQPQVVVLRQGDLTAEEAAKIKQNTVNSKKSEDPEPEDGKHVFRKPAKRSSGDNFTGLTATSSKKKKEERKEQTEPSNSENKPKQIKNSSLLSFEDDEEDD
ncbi:uncharacterized protein KIAA1143 homolog [Chiloscyllium plagiosum]|uniref:uncharacterized protein KIAA1143 homolog n=1 Tax=Chiloscyllium plagiosum TaxID=36176 RepID=UPI001CB816B9|nr:uncharacterized protein KIAA1143 homolog [Chiloscyllium plagiosum]